MARVRKSSQSRSQIEQTADCYAQLKEWLAEREANLQTLHDELKVLRHSEARFRSIAESALDALVVIGENGRVLEVNPAAERLFGYPHREFIGLPVQRIMPKRYHQEYRDGIARLIRRGRSPKPGQVRQFEARRRDGREFPVEVSLSGFHSEEGWVFTAFIRDVTGRRRMEETFRHIVQGIGAKTGDSFFRALVQHLAEALRMDFAFVGRVCGEKRVQTVALYARGEFVDPFAYSVAGTPCERVLAGRVVCYPRAVAGLFPEDRYLADEGIESYMGVPLFVSGKRPVGLLSVLHGAPLQDVSLLEQVLHLFGVRAAAELERRQSEEALRLTQFSVDKSADPVFWVSPDARFLYVNDAACRNLGYSRKEMLRMTVPDIDPYIPKKDWPKIWKKLKADGSMTLEVGHRTKSGKILPVEITANYLKFAGKEYSFAFARDISERRQSEEALRLTQFSVDKSADPVFWVSPDARFLYVNDAACRHLGYSRKEMLRMTVPDIDPYVPKEAWPQLWKKLKADGSMTLEVGHRTKSGKILPVEITANYFKFAGKEYAFAFARDISARKRAEEALAEQAIRDELTGLYNRRHFRERIAAEIAQAQQSDQQLALLLCDLDRFKAVNDTRGHQAGDEVLQAAAKSIQCATRGGDLVFRWGGDEILVLLSRTSREGVHIVAERILEGVQKAGRHLCHGLDVSIGVALYPEHGRDPDTLVSLADRALYIAKKGGDKIHVGEEEYGLHDHTIRVVFQPLLDLKTREVWGYEALSRDGQGRLSIADLFKKYHAVGQLQDLKGLCFRTQQRAVRQLGITRAFLNVDFKVLSQSSPLPIPPGIEIVLEISESEAVYEVEGTLELIREWRDMGYRFAIDDFGAGFISLPFIARLLPDYIKLDRSALLQAVDSEGFCAMLRDLLLSLRKYAGHGIVAEGIETERELKTAAALGADLGQGFLFGKPGPLP